MRPYTILYRLDAMTVFNIIIINPYILFFPDIYRTINYRYHDDGVYKTNFLHNIDCDIISECKRCNGVHLNVLQKMLFSLIILVVFN